jgi:hypothetical protein
MIDTLRHYAAISITAITGRFHYFIFSLDDIFAISDSDYCHITFDTLSLIADTFRQPRHFSFQLFRCRAISQRCSHCRERFRRYAAS